MGTIIIVLWEYGSTDIKQAAGCKMKMANDIELLMIHLKQLHSRNSPEIPSRTDRMDPERLPLITRLPKKAHL